MHEIVKDYYGKQLKSSDDLKTSACCDASSMPAWLKPVLGNIHPEVLSRYYGCGLVCPDLLKGCRILDLGSGSGRDVYALAQLAGKDGEVIGVDMTPQQLEIARKYQEYHTEKFGFNNVHFYDGYIEKLDELDLQPDSFDVVVSNCVINLSPDKDAVLKGVYKLLKTGGEFYFSDVYANRRLPEAISKDPVLYGECIGGALYWNDFYALAKSNGFTDVRLTESRPLEITDPVLKEKLGDCQFLSATYRLFKIDDLENDAEDYGQAVIYNGTIPGKPDSFKLDDHCTMKTKQAFPVSGNTWKILSESRFQPHFEFVGNFSQHFGIFPICRREIPFKDQVSGKYGGCTC